MDPVEHNQIGHIMIGMKAPNFDAVTTFGPLKMSDYKGKWLVFFSHPGDYTPVCTTEFLAFAKMYPKFAAMNTELLGLSIDSNPSHLGWVYSIYLGTETQIPFPIVADRIGEVARLYGMVSYNVSTQSTVRSVFIIDPEQTVRAILTYPMTNGRNTEEILRLVQALQVTDKFNVVTPANWVPGQSVLVPAAKTYEELLERENHPKELGLACEDWFWCYKNLPENVEED